MSQPDLEKWINLCVSGESPMMLPEETEILELLKELRERRKVRHPDEIKEELAMWKKSCSELNNNLVFQCKSARINELEWVLSPEKEQRQ